ncbi:MAG: 3-dehydroquinate synthase [Sarcina sp.]
MKKLRVNLQERSYDILIQSKLRENLSKYIREVYSGNKIAIITDTNLFSIYGNEIKTNLENNNFEIKFIVIEAGEKSKSFSSLLPIYNELLEFKLTRSDLILTLGGGVVGDLGGFVASTFLRGVSFIQMPTSLLAQVDSSVGGKVGVDLEAGKNLIGSFYHPKRVLIDTQMLTTLSEKFFNDGLGEVVKYGCIKDKKLFETLENFKNKDELKNNIDDIIFTCCDIKRQVVENDERDTGERMLLNFGHTLGHAIEKFYDFEVYSHGEAVAIGMYQITAMSEKSGDTKVGSSKRIKNLLDKYDLPFECDVIRNGNENLIEAIKLDKKNLNDSLNVILINDIGDSYIYKTTYEYFK